VGGGPYDNGNGSSEVIGGYGGRVASSLVREQREKQKAKDRKKEGRDREVREERY
jgi:hypothetical protein